MEYKGFEIANESVRLEGESLVASADMVHQGKLGGIKIKVEGSFKFIPLVEKAIDKLEEIIPGDQKSIAETLKGAIKLIKIKF